MEPRQRVHARAEPPARRTRRRTGDDRREPSTEAPPEAAPSLGNQAMQRMLQREPSGQRPSWIPSITVPGVPSGPNLNLDPAAVARANEARWRPVRTWLDANMPVRSGLAVVEVVKRAWEGSTEARALAMSEVRECVVQWGRENGFKFAAFPVLGGPGIEAVATVSLEAPQVSVKGDAGSIKTEAEVPVGPSLKFSTEVGAKQRKKGDDGKDVEEHTTVKVGVALDVLPAAVEQFQNALKVKTPIGKMKLSFSAELQAEIEAKAKAAGASQEAAGVVKGEVGAELKLQILQLPVYLKSEIKASAGLSSKEGPGTELEVTPLKLVVTF
jgi:hypothetical protein